MPVKNQPFRAFRPGDQPRPLLYVRYRNLVNNSHLQSWALIDTGADDCVLPAAFAPILGFNLEEGDRFPIVGVSGHAIAYRHPIVIEIPGFTTEELMISFIKGLHQPLLGARSFLSRFVLTIDYYNNCFSLVFGKELDPEDAPLSWPRP